LRCSAAAGRRAFLETRNTTFDVVRVGLATTMLCVVGVLAAPAGAAITKVDRYGTIVLNGRKVFPIVLSKGPERGSTTPAGRDGLAEVAAAGVNFVRVGPAAAWTDAELADAIEWNRAAAARGLNTWVNLASLSRMRPGSWQEELIRHVIGSLEGDPSGSAIGMWKGVDEPWRLRVRPPSLRFAYCLATGRGERRWCAGRRPIDTDHVWVTVQAPRAGVWSLAPYSAVTDVHGVNKYPIAIGDPDPKLDEVGSWTNVLSLATPTRSVWTTLQVCWTWSYDAAGNVALPTMPQERYMVYDAIVNGARSLAFYGANNPRCWGAVDSVYGWNWTFWEAVLGPLIREISAGSPIAPALVNPGSTRVLLTSDPTVEAISRRGAGRDLWVIATRSGDGSQPVTISGLPSGVTAGAVYTEDRGVSAAAGSFTDTFDRWAVHVYRFRR
jgi:hypothetical protein